MMQRANANVLLCEVQDGRENAADRLHTVALLSRKRRKKKQKNVRMVQILVQRRGLAAFSCPGC